MQIILLGAPGAGKGTQAASLERELRLAHIASGDLFRQAEASGSELGKLARPYMEKGLLVPDEITIKLILERLAAPDCAAGCILDGFPRNLEQARALDSALAEQGKAIDKVLYIKVSTDEMLRRLSGRRICRSCQAPYHVNDLPPRIKGKCDRCGGELYQRADDEEETVRNRLEVYLAQTQPLIDYYAAAGKLVGVDGEKGVEQTTEELLAALKTGA